MFYVYAYFYPDSNLPFYIGKGKGNRKNDHIYAARRSAHSNKLLQSVIKKIIADGLYPCIEILKTFNDEDDAYNYEEHLISTFGRRLVEGGPLCNISSGGRGPKGRKHTEETKQKMRGRKVSPETRALLSKSKKGITLTEEQRLRRKKVQPWNHRPEVIAKMQRPKTRQHALAIKLAQTGEHCPRAKTWKICSPNGEIYVITSLKTFCQQHNLNETAIYRSLERKKPVTRGKSKGWLALPLNH